jgi:hypothetical protein
VGELDMVYLVYSSTYITDYTAYPIDNIIDISCIIELQDLNLMDGMDILKRIVQEEGNCCWSRPSICAQCPLSKLKKKPDGSYMSCIESIGIQDLTEEAADARYKEIAVRLLLDEAIDDLLRGEDGPK